MSEAPKQIWVWWDDEYDVGVVSKHGDKRYIPDEAREYVRADRIEELEAKAMKAANAALLEKRRADAAEARVKELDAEIAKWRAAFIAQTKKLQEENK
jgi:hypothetical protein